MAEAETSAIIRVKRLRVSARIGCSDTERLHEQTLEIDLELNVPSAYTSGKEADLSKSVCYLDLRNKTRDMVQGRPWVLVEELCYSVLDLIFTNYSLVEGAKVSCRKFVLADCDWSEIQLSRGVKSHIKPLPFT